MYIENDFIDEMKKELTDPVDNASKHDIEKAVVEICGDTEKTIKLSGNAINFLQLGPNLVPHLPDTLCPIYCLKNASSKNGLQTADEAFEDGIKKVCCC